MPTPPPACRTSATLSATSDPVTAWSLATLARWLKREAAVEPLFASWNAVLQWGARHRCTGILLRAAAEARWLDERGTHPLKTATFSLQLRAMCHVAECRKIEKHLRRRGIPCLFLKGVALGNQLYNNAALRAGGDIDLLVDTDDTLETLTCLLRLNYAPIGTSVDHIRRGWNAFRRFDNHIRLQNPDNGVLVELHWRLFREHWPLESTIRESLHAERSRPDCSDTLRSLRPALSFVYLVEHGAKHSFYAAQWLVDAVMQWRKLSNEQRSEARWLVQRYALERKLSLAAEMAATLLDVDVRDERWPCCPPLPRSVMDFALKRFCAVDPLADIDSAWHLRYLRCQLALAGRWRQRASFLLFSTITTPTLLQWRVPSPLIFLYPILRLLSLVARAAGLRPRMPHGYFADRRSAGA